ncbi:hypothetical protein J1614_006165 [Plenodomus biglobosus]|nr:hypothetical protein J1614_006165 [Plenodomus biglobosus]
MDGTAIDYATSKDWLDIMKNRSKVRMHELIERLGLRAKWSSNKRGKTNFESAVVRELVADMGDVVSTLPKEPDELMKFLSEEGSLKVEVDGLLEKHGAKIWARAGEREHLISANEPGVEDGVYPRDLYFEVDQDRQLVHKLLHWWIGLKACNVILARERLDRERRKKAENRQVRVEAEFAGQNEGGTPASFVALAPNSVLHEADTTSRGSPMSSSAMLTPPESGESPIVGPREGPNFSVINNGSHATDGNKAFSSADLHHQHAGQQPRYVVGEVWNRLASGTSRESSALSVIGHQLPTPDTKGAAQQQIVDANQATVDRQISMEIAKLVASFRTPDAAATEEIPQPTNSIPYRGLDEESVRALRRYVYEEENGIQVDEETLLNRLELAWREGVRADYHKMVENIPVFIARERAILTWLELRRHLAALERAGERWRSEGHSNAEIERRIQQHRTLMGCTQTVIANFEDVGQGFGLGPNVAVDRDELLRQAMIVLAGERYAIEMQWRPVEFTSLIRWLSEELDMYRKDEEEEGRGMAWFLSQT